jgi:hypothetical protein
VQFHESHPFSLYARISFLVGLTYVKGIPAVVYEVNRAEGIVSAW